MTASLRASGEILHQLIRPFRSHKISPAFSSIIKCLEIDAREVSNGSAISVTDMSSSNRSINILRLVLSDSAANIRSKCLDLSDFILIALLLNHMVELKILLLKCDLLSHQEKR